MSHNRANEPLKIAIIGAGAAGLTTAYILQRGHHVTLYERERKAGGHINTVTIPEGPDAGTAVDTGFIVFNDENYPLFNHLLKQLNVEIRYSDMSFSYYSEVTGLQYAGTGINGIFAQRCNLLNIDHWRLIRNISRFCTEARKQLVEDSLKDQNLGEFLVSGGFDGPVSDDYVLPLAGAIWSASRDDIRSFPAETLLSFFNNHGLFSLFERPRWKTIVGGSRVYVDQLLKGFDGDLEIAHPVRSIRRDCKSVQVCQADGSRRIFDRVILAVHADEALNLLEDPSTDERGSLGTWRYNESFAVLHSGQEFMPPNHRAWASWNYRRSALAGDSEPVMVTYHMNRLQGLRTRSQYFVSLNPEPQIDTSRSLARIRYTHPCFTRQALDTQPRIQEINGDLNTYYCGSYLGYGFHEDAVRSAVAIGRKFGIEL